tara:strand:- start:12088 stop:12921 length:834 start_codon:yes stop_codon:yes gene_type:complete
MTRILAFSGKKQSGKSTHTNFIHGYQLKSFHVIQNYALTKEGNLLVETNGSSDQEPVYSKLDISRTDDEFADWASYHMWPFVKKYSFAHPLKSIAVELFGIRPEQVNGSDFDKNTKTHLRWEDMPILKSGKRTSQKKGRMTAREFLQFFGTEICRHMYEDIWSESLIRAINSESPLIAVIDDVRFENEIKAVQDAGGKVVRLTRKSSKDNHKSETELDSYKGFDCVIDNTKMSINETNQEIIKALKSWNWLGEELQPRPQKPNEERQLVGGIHQIKG